VPWCQSLLTSNLYYVSGLSVFFFGVFPPDRFFFLMTKTFEKIEENFGFSSVVNSTKTSPNFLYHKFGKKKKKKPWRRLELCKFF
jgi:hypothetical protein